MAYTARSKSGLACGPAQVQASATGRRSLGRIAWAWTFNGALIGGVIYAVSGGYSAAIHQRDSRITIEADPGLPIANLAASIGDEDRRQINCLAKTIYFEARGEGLEGMKAVSDVVYNRLKSGLYPDSICQIVYQGPIGADGLPLRDKCQFSWYCDGIEHKVTDKTKWAESVSVAYNQFLYHMPSLVGGATAYHNQTVSPTSGIWRNAKAIVRIGQHTFYEPQGRFAVRGQ